VEVFSGMLVSRWVRRFRSYLVSPPLIFALLWYRWEVEVETLTWLLGICLVLMGMILRIWAQQHLHYRHSLKFKKQLTTTGPYSFVRNPLYIGNIMLCLGVTVASEILWLVPITFLYGLWIYSLVVQYEEAHLREKYGEPYRRYLTEVPRWVPSFGSFKKLGLKTLGLKNEYLRHSIFAEIHCLFLLVPYIFKELVSLWIAN